MPGGVQLTLQQRKQQIVGGLQKTAEKKGALKISSQQLVNDSRQFETGMSRTSRFMSVLGIGKLFHRKKEVSSSALVSQVPEQRQMRTDAEKELSYQKKTSKQEEAARKRGEFTGNLFTRQQGAAQDALNMYNSDDDDEEMDEFEEADGTEFSAMKSQDYDREEGADNIHRIMVTRDKLKADIERLQADKNKATEAYVEQLKEKLACTEDALNTFYQANGLSLDGKTVSDREAAKAREHLPLALEKYEYMYRNHERLFGQSMMKTISKIPEWSAEKNQARQDDAAYSQQNNRITGIPADYEDVYDRVQDIISSHPFEYMANKKQIDQAFVRFTQCLKKIDEMNVDNSIATRLMGGVPGEVAEAARQGIAAIGHRNEAVKNLLAYQAESSQALIEYLLEGKQVDVLHGQFIEKTWGVKTYDRDPAAPLNETIDEFKTVKTEYTDRVKAIERALSSEQDPVKLKVLRKASERLTGVKDMGCAHMADALSYANEDAVEAAILKEKVFGKPEYAPFKKVLGIKLLAETMTPINGKPAFDEAGLLSYAHQMAVVRTGSDMDGNDATAEERSQAFRSTLGLYMDQAEELERYIQDNPAMFANRNAYSAMRDWSGLPRFEKKAFGVAKGMEVLIESPLFTELNEADMKDLVDLYNRMHRVAMCSGELLAGIAQYENDSAEEYARKPMSYRITERAKFNGTGPLFRESNAESYSKPAFKRNFHPVLPAQAQ